MRLFLDMRTSGSKDSKPPEPNAPTKDSKPPSQHATVDASKVVEPDTANKDNRSDKKEAADTTTPAATTKPSSNAPKPSVPPATTAAKPTPVESKPVEPKPVDQKVDDGAKPTPDEPKPVEPKPVDQKVDDSAKPTQDEPKPVEPKPVDQKLDDSAKPAPVEAKPADEKAVDSTKSTPVEAKPSGAQPDDVKSDTQSTLTDSDADSGKKETTSEPADGAKREPDDVKKENPPAKQKANRANDSKPGAAHNQPKDKGRKKKAEGSKQNAKAKNDTADDGAHDTPDGIPGDRKGNLADDTADDTADNDRLHDDFFRKGEEVEQENIALSQSGRAMLADADEPYSVGEDSGKEGAKRRRRMGGVVALVLVPAVALAVWAGAKLFTDRTAALHNPHPPSASVLPPPSAALSTGEPSAAGSNTAPTSPSTAGDAMEEDSQDASAEDNALVDDTTADGTADGAADATADSEVDEATDKVVDGAAAGEGQDAVAAVEPDAMREPDAAGAVPAASTANLPEGADPRKEALKALEQSKWKVAEEMARIAVERFPEDANSYLYLAASLTETGRAGEAKQVYRKCVELAKRGPLYECRMFAK